MGFLLVEGFSLMSYASAVEPLRAANVLSGKPLYQWFNIAAGASTASSGLPVPADFAIGERTEFDTVFVCAAGNPTTFRHRPTLSWLRQLARNGTRVGGISGGPFILARAGLLDGYRATIHWEHVPAFAEAFPDLQLTRALFEIDRDRLTCGGGVAALDMMHALIAGDHGPALANSVSDWFLQTEIRGSAGLQRLSPSNRYGTADARVLAALERMEASIDQPASRGELAAASAISIRQLERLFSAELGTTIASYYQRLRLERARVLLRQSALPIVEIAVMTGFISASHFSRLYRSRFGIAPRHERH